MFMWNDIGSDQFKIQSGCAPRFTISRITFPRTVTEIIEHYPNGSKFRVITQHVDVDSGVQGTVFADITTEERCFGVKAVFADSTTEEICAGVGAVFADTTTEGICVGIGAVFADITIEGRGVGVTAVFADIITEGICVGIRAVFADITTEGRGSQIYWSTNPLRCTFSCDKSRQ